jgi:hypothetical protein
MQAHGNEALSKQQTPFWKEKSWCNNVRVLKNSITNFERGNL